MIIPISEKMFSVCPNKCKLNTAPAKARGTDHNDERINKTFKLRRQYQEDQASANKKAKELLDELSA
jgi:hypothetical protein